MRHLAVLFLTLILACTTSFAGYDIPTDVFLRAWSTSVKIAKDHGLPGKQIPGPPITLWEPELVLQERCWPGEEADTVICQTVRILGYYQNQLHLKKGHVRLKERIVLLVTPEEHAACDGMLKELMIHEFLHYLYLRLVIYDDEFQEAHPDEHQWIDEVYDWTMDTCWAEEDDDEETSDATDGVDSESGSGSGDAADSADNHPCSTNTEL